MLITLKKKKKNKTKRIRWSKYRTTNRLIINIENYQKQKRETRAILGFSNLTWFCTMGMFRAKRLQQRIERRNRFFFCTLHVLQGKFRR